MKASTALAPAVLMSSLLAAYVQAAPPATLNLFDGVTVGAALVSSAPANVSGFQTIEVVGRAAGGANTDGGAAASLRLKVIAR